MYLDSAYIAKFYLAEPDSPRVRAVISEADVLISSAISMGEMACIFHRQMREGFLRKVDAQKMLTTFLGHVENGVWTLIPVSESILRRACSLVSAAPVDTFLRAGDAIHLTTAREAGEHEIWASDRHLLAAAPHFGLIPRSA